MKRRVHDGSAVLAVTLALLVIAALSYLFTLGGATDLALSAGVKDGDAAKYISEAGLQHMREALREENCNNYKNLGTTNFGDGQYSVTVIPKNSSPVTLVATGQTRSGAAFSFRQAAVRVFDAPLSTTLNPGRNVEDTWINQTEPVKNYGKTVKMEIGEFGIQTSYALIRFNLSTFPTGARINAATMRLYFDGASVQPPGSGIFVHRIESSWDEGRRHGSFGDGATWTDRDWRKPWNSVGGDYESAAITFLPLGAPGEYHFFDITLVMQEWINRTRPNYGLLLRSSAGVNQAEFMTGDESSTSKRPRLLVSFACECGIEDCVDD